MTFPLFLVPVTIVASIAAAVGLWIMLTGRDKPRDRR
jgi:hypothetical protein